MFSVLSSTLYAVHTLFRPSIHIIFGLLSSIVQASFEWGTRKKMCQPARHRYIFTKHKINQSTFSIKFYLCIGVDMSFGAALKQRRRQTHIFARSFQFFRLSIKNPFSRVLDGVVFPPFIFERLTPSVPCRSRGEIRRRERVALPVCY